MTNTHLVAPGIWRFRMLDNGTGSTNYLVEYRSDLFPTNGWSFATNVTALPGGEFQVAAAVAPSQGYFRLKGLRNVVANFSNTEVMGEEAGQVSVVVVFDAPYVGTVRYTIGGTAATNDYAGLTGQVQVYGTTAVIPITLTDNTSLDQLRCLTLQLEPAPGLQLGAAYRNTITISENDAAWQGVFFLTNGLAQTTTNVIAGQTNFALPQNANMPFQFTLKIQQSGGASQGALSGAPGGFFPTNETPASISFTPTRFTAYGEEIVLPVESPLLGSPPRVSLRLIADTSTTNQIVSPTLLAGQARLLVRYTPATHLNTTTYGWFQLVRPPPPASTNLVKLVTVP